MTVLDKIAFFRGIRNDVPNQELARQLAESGDAEGVAVIAAHLWDENPNVSSDCIKVLYETGYLAPDLIAAYGADFIQLLNSKHNRMVWGGMIALSTIAALRPEQIYEQRGIIFKVIETGSVITQDAGVKSLAVSAAVCSQYRADLAPYLLNFLCNCRPSDLPRHAESIDKCIDASMRQEFTAILHERLPLLTPAQAKRVAKILNKHTVNPC